MSRLDARIVKRRFYVRVLASVLAVPGFAFFGWGLVLIGQALKRHAMDDLLSGTGIFIAAVGAVMGYSGVTLAMEFSPSMVSLACVGPAAIVWVFIAGLPERFNAAGDALPLGLSLSMWRMIAAIISTIAATLVYTILSKFLLRWTQALSRADSLDQQTSSTSGVQR